MKCDEKSCGAIVLRKDTKDPSRRFLLVIRQHSHGPITFPKGHVEPGESEIETAEREVFEETAVRIKINCGFRETVYYRPNPEVLKEVVYFLAETDDIMTVPQKGEIAEAFWVDAEKAGKIIAFRNDRRLLDKALEYIKKNFGVDSDKLEYSEEVK
ncbi:MAG: NUDIX domain-containing protein [Clostridia bacterium]|nr:NUDIX domain-containing protein [Clostridia bacterium]